MQSISVLRIFWVFLKLGCTSFGGPAAHLVFFHQCFVKNKQWLSNTEYAQIMALAQLLPGPTSSQAGIGIGYLKRGYAGAAAAWLGFTLPSAVLMGAAAIAGQHYFKLISTQSFHIIQLLVFAVVIHAFWQMFKSFCGSFWHKMIMLSATALILLLPSSSSQICAILAAGTAGLIYAKLQSNTAVAKPAADSVSVMSQMQKLRASFWLLLFFLPFALFLFLPQTEHSVWRSIYDFYQSASLVFGGGHVVLPLMYEDFVATQQISAEAFHAGYALAQLMPGPLFSFASYLGVLLPLTPWPALNAMIAVAAIFLPSFFLMFAALPCWNWLMQRTFIHTAVLSINAAAVGLLLAMLIPMGSQTILQIADAIILLTLVLLFRTSLPIWLILMGAFAVCSVLFRLF